MSVLNGDAPVRYRIRQGDQNWVVKLSAPDMDGSKLLQWVADNKIEGEITVTFEWRILETPGAAAWNMVGPMTIDTDDLR